MKMDTMYIKYNMSKTNKKEIESFTYVYANGDNVQIEMSGLPEEMRTEIAEMKRLEYNCDQREKRRHRGLPVVSDNGIPDSVEVAAERQERYDNLKRAIGQLLPEQKKLIRQIYFENIKAIEIARRDGVCKSTISHRLDRTLKQLKKNVA